MFRLSRRGAASPVRAPRSAAVRVEELEPRNLLSVLTPAQVRHAYGVDQASYNVGSRTVVGDGSGQTIAIVDAYHDPYIAQDLQNFDRQFGLPAPPSFRQYYYGSANNINDGWSFETALDVEWAHAIAPKANILLIEAASSSGQDMYTAVNWVRQQAGVSVVSMSWGAPEWSGETGADGYLRTPSGHNGITFVASAGDQGGQRLFPAMSPNVVAVGGTVLSADGSGNYQRESAWSAGGGGVSNYEGEPGFQRSVQSYGRRSGPDVAYNAGTGVYVAWTKPSSRQQGWYSATGTSAGAPQWAAIIAIADQIRVAAGEHTLDGASQTLYGLYNSAMTGDFHDITSGSNGYAARSGYDLATGRGTPYASKVILDLARISDGFHGAVSSSTAMSADRRAMLSVAEGGDAGGGAEGATAVLSDSGGPEAASPAIAAESREAVGLAGANPAGLTAEGHASAGFGSGSSALGLAASRAADVEAVSLAWDAAFEEGAWV